MLHQAAHVLGRELSSRTVMFHAAIGERLGLSATDHKALDIVMRVGPLTAGEMAAEAGLTTGAVTGVLDRLEKAGFVHRERHPADRRKIIVRATDSEKLEGEIAPLFGPFEFEMEGLTARYNDQELAIIVDFLTRVTEVLTRVTRDMRSESAQEERS